MRATERPAWEQWETTSPSLYKCDNNSSWQALGLVDYDDILPLSDVHSLVALISALHQAFSQCSKVFINVVTFLLLLFPASGICRTGISGDHQWWKTYTTKWPVTRNIYKVSLITYCGKVISTMPTVYIPEQYSKYLHLCSIADCSIRVYWLCWGILIEYF